VLGPASDHVFERRLLFEDALRLVGVVPEIGMVGKLRQLVDSLLLAVDVKDASAIARAAAPNG
jgi:hypothetical protein